MRGSCASPGEGDASSSGSAQRRCSASFCSGCARRPRSPTRFSWAHLAGKVERAFPVAILGLFFSGAYMTSDVWTWGTGWIDVGIVSLVVLAATGILIAGRRAKELEATLQANGAGQLSAASRKLTCDPALWIVSFGNPGLVLGVVWNMTQKPGTVGAIVAVVVGYAVGGAVALQFAKSPNLAESSPTAA